jgi:hypothetical protein
MNHLAAQFIRVALNYTTLRLSSRVIRTNHLHGIPQRLHLRRASVIVLSLAIERWFAWRSDYRSRRSRTFSEAAV